MSEHVTMREVSKMLQEDSELVLALERAKAKLQARRQNAGEVEGNAIKHNLHAANLITGSYTPGVPLAQVQRDLAKKIIDRANQKERIRL